MSHFSLPTDCTVGQSAALKAALHPLVMSDETTVVLSAQDVERCDASLLQLLVALGTRLSLSQRALELRSPSPVLLACAAQLGLSHVVNTTVRP